MVNGKNGIGQNGMDKMVRIKYQVVNQSRSYTILSEPFCPVTPLSRAHRLQFIHIILNVDVTTTHMLFAPPHFKVNSSILTCNAVRH